jgi:hypothetical protein
VNHIGYSFVSQDLKGSETMKNADMPAMPIEDVYHENCATEYGSLGLTKREYTAIKIMAGFASDPRIEAPADMVAILALGWADAILAELDKEPTQ